LMEVHAVTVGRTLDVEVRRRGADFNVRLPRILGSDPAGVVRAVGSEVTNFSVGDRVVCTSSLFCNACRACLSGATHACVAHGAFGVHVDGGDAELCAVPARTLVPIPPNVDYAQAASMAVNYPLAYNLLSVASVGPGDEVLVMGAGGGLGIAGVLVATLLGARPIAAAGSDWKLDRCRELLGVDRTVNYARPGWAQAVREMTRNGQGVATVYENIGDPSLFDEAMSTLRTGGWLVTAGAHAGGVVALDLRVLYRSRLRVAGETGAPIATAHQIFDCVASGQLPPPPVCHRYALEDIAAAHQAAAGRDLFGRIVLLTAAGVASMPPEKNGALGRA
jgi:NADPH2:quinone reductase